MLLKLEPFLGFKGIHVILTEELQLTITVNCTIAWMTLKLITLDWGFKLSANFRLWACWPTIWWRRRLHLWLRHYTLLFHDYLLIWLILWLLLSVLINCSLLIKCIHCSLYKQLTIRICDQLLVRFFNHRVESPFLPGLVSWLLWLLDHIISFLKLHTVKVCRLNELVCTYARLDARKFWEDLRAQMRSVFELKCEWVHHYCWVELPSGRWRSIL